jgi:hypothetical protein
MKIGCVMRHDKGEKMYGVGSRELSNGGCARASVVTKEGLGANSLRGCQVQ